VYILAEKRTALVGQLRTLTPNPIQIQKTVRLQTQSTDKSTFMSDTNVMPAVLIQITRAERVHISSGSLVGDVAIKKLDAG
jgi:hypothetical protein